MLSTLNDERLTLTQFMDEINRRLNMLDRSFRQDAMSEIKDKTRIVAGLAKDGLDPSLDFMHGREQHDRIHITLQGDVTAQPPPRFTQRDSPIHTHHRASGVLIISSHLAVPGPKWIIGTL